MKNSELYLKCLELAMRPVRGINYNYDSLRKISDVIFSNSDMSELEKFSKILSDFSENPNIISTFPDGPDGKPIMLSTKQLNPTIKRTLPLDICFKIADEIYVKATSYDDEGN